MLLFGYGLVIFLRFFFLFFFCFGVVLVFSWFKEGDVVFGFCFFVKELNVCLVRKGWGFGRTWKREIL